MARCHRATGRLIRDKPRPGAKLLSYKCFDYPNRKPYTIRGTSCSMDKERARYVAEKYDLPMNAGYALQLFEMGYSTSGASNVLDLAESTVKSYHAKLMDRIHPDVVMPVTTDGKNGKRFDTFPQRDRPDLDRYAGHYIDYAPEFSQQELPVNKGIPLSEIDASLMSAPKQ